ncbi:branched-chain amino acid ABC transporter permease [Sphingobium jiangsuense]|uniref:Urea transport system permease protein n=1 Tax=Sphingobium jiangsuense TaxID=870476 RepID=A0A7W6BH98_9SPHN|nr:urea ABC transporter permease subunit UrtB [Sphingobium jiangsuense]MBB3926014.1 urea transport system permease protein [Sphingobium jiangsuense]GLS98946.1 branched-chain amino acid ABC transporter permease [Sphingobium jiangsuense]
MDSVALFLPQLFNGLSVASLYLLAAVGLALSFGLMRVINMAHGEMLMLGGYLAWLTLMVVPGAFGILLALPVAFLGTAAIGALVHMGLIRRLADRPLDTLLATWGLSLILQQAARDLFGAIGVEVRAPDWLAGSISLGDVVIPSARLMIIVMTLLVLGGIALMLNRSRIGLDIRAVNQDRMMASATGINVRKVELTVFCAGAGVAGLAGVLLALLGPVTPNAGQVYIVPAFLVVVMGGLGSLTGTSMAALILGLFSALAQIFFDVSIAQMLMLVLVILFLQIRPQGVVAVRSRALDV